MSCSMFVIRDFLSSAILIHILCFLIYSYRENSGESQTDDDDVLEWTQPEKEEPEGPPVETIEKVLKRRIGRKMGQYRGLHSLCWVNTSTLTQRISLEY